MSTSYPEAQKWIGNYIKDQRALLNTIDHADVSKLIHILFTAWENDRQIFVIGNGGSAANASHFATDLGKLTATKMKRRFRVQSLTDNVAWITALGNDANFNLIFSEQLKNSGQKDDVLIAISVSGASGNVIYAVQIANELGLNTVAIVGKNGQGQLAHEAKTKIVLNSDHYGRVEDAQMTILHMAAYAFKELYIG